MMMDTSFNYDAFLEEVGRARAHLEPSWVLTRSLEDAQAFAAWCIENGIEEPRIAIVDITP